jgi:hypothetical protein
VPRSGTAGKLAIAGLILLTSIALPLMVFEMGPEEDPAPVVLPEPAPKTPEAQPEPQVAVVGADLGAMQAQRMAQLLSLRSALIDELETNRVSLAEARAIASPVAVAPIEAAVVKGEQRVAETNERLLSVLQSAAQSGEESRQALIMALDPASAPSAAPIDERVTQTLGEIKAKLMSMPAGSDPKIYFQEVLSVK